MVSNSKLDAAYQFCLKLSHRHYENFPVASFLLPKKMRHPVSVIYAFARTADDFADEGSDDMEIRLKKLNNYRLQLKQINENGSTDSDNPIFLALADIIGRYKIPCTLFDNLLIAFIQDVNKTRYQNFEQVLDYCRYSANPVGRLLLHLDGHADDTMLTESDAICTALQLINFYQDITQDYVEQNRVYLPLDEMTSADVDVQQLAGKKNTSTLVPLLRRQYQRAKEILASGSELGNRLNGRFGWEIRATILGGATILNKLEQQSGSTMLSRPRLNRSELVMLLINSASKKRYLSILSKKLTN